MVPLLIVLLAAVLAFLWFRRTPLELFTLQSLKQFNGTNGKTYIAVDGLVFDVSASEAYKPDGSYAVLAGADCSVCLAKMSLEPGQLNKQVDLSVSERKTLDEWTAYMKKKYRVIGKLQP